MSGADAVIHGVTIHTYTSGREGRITVTTPDGETAYTDYGPGKPLRNALQAREHCFKMLWPGCVEHHSKETPCSHCKADDEIMEEKIENVARAVERMIENDEYPYPINVLKDALRELVREVRRG